MGSPYSGIQREQGRRERDSCTSHAASVLEKNLKELVKDHLHTCIALSTRQDSSQCNFDREYWMHEEHQCNDYDLMISRRRQQSRIVDQWATRQAREMISTLEKQSCEAELLALSNLQPVSTRASSFQRETSPAFSDCSVDVPHARASSLVQMWREIESESKAKQADNASSTEEASGGSEVCNSGDDRSDMEWESDHVAIKMQASSRTSHRRGSKRVKVTDMIKRLTSADHGHGSLTSCTDETEQEHPASSMCISGQGDNMIFSTSRKFPCIRGRQAIWELLARLARERQKELATLEERRAVSQFSHRSRIQALLRFRLLQSTVACQEQQRPSSTAIELDQLQRRCSILELRERFNSRNQQDRSTITLADSSSSHLMQCQNNSMDSNCSHLAVPFLNEDDQYFGVAVREEEISQKETHSLPSACWELHEEANKNPDNAPHERNVLYGSHSLEVGDRNVENTLSVPPMLPYSTIEKLQEEDMQSSNVPWQEWGLSTSYHEWQETINAAEHGITEKLQEQADQSSNVSWQEGELLASNHELEETVTTVESLHSWEGNITIEDSHSDAWRHVEEMDRNLFGDASHQWIQTGCKQPTYCDWIENISYNVEICELLDRRTVSTALASDFRCKIEQVILSNLQRRVTQSISDDGIKEEEEHSVVHFQEEHSVDNADQVASTSLQLPLLSRPFHQCERQEQASHAHHSAEMALIYDLRRDMERLHQDVSELRKSIEHCVNMQVEFQHATRHEISPGALHCSGETNTLQSSICGTIAKNICCICNKTQVDSLLYRCGHMCACFECANELQWSNGMCPICQAPIADVVRAFSYQ